MSDGGRCPLAFIRNICMIVIPPVFTIEAGITVPDGRFIIRVTTFTHDAVMFNIIPAAVVSAAFARGASASWRCFPVTTYLRRAAGIRRGYLRTIYRIIRCVGFGDSCLVTATHCGNSINNPRCFIPSP